MIFFHPYRAAQSTVEYTLTNVWLAWIPISKHINCLIHPITCSATCTYLSVIVLVHTSSSSFIDAFMRQTCDNWQGMGWWDLHQFRHVLTPFIDRSRIKHFLLTISSNQRPVIKELQLKLFIRGCTSVLQVFNAGINKAFQDYKIELHEKSMLGWSQCKTSRYQLDSSGLSKSFTW